MGRDSKGPGRRARGHALLIVIAVALTCSAVALAAPRTTGPSKRVTVLVLINDKGIAVHPYVAVGSDSDLGQNLQVLRGPIPRGDYLSFNVLNRGKKTHSFTIFGKTTSPIKPGGKAHLFVAATVRGNFNFGSTLDKGKSFRGSIDVY
jgi:hypothetical protein